MQKLRVISSDVSAWPSQNQGFVPHSLTGPRSAPFGPAVERFVPKPSAGHEPFFSHLHSAGIERQVEDDEQYSRCCVADRISRGLWKHQNEHQAARQPNYGEGNTRRKFVTG